MKQAIISLSISIMLWNFSLAKAQGSKNDPVLLSIGGKDITKTEFEKIYKKNATKEATDKHNVQEYLDLFVNYKLKVREAEEMGLDTAESFKNELKGYRKQLSQPYLTDKDVTDRLMQEAYERMKTDVRASHILIKLSPDALPKDTLAAYNRIMELRKRILKGEDFAKIAKDSSQDPSAKENGGDLGYFTSMQMVYPFESAAYNSKVGEVSMPVRSHFGYHLIKVTDTRPAQGEITVAHIMIKSATGALATDAMAAKKKIDNISRQLKEGANFEDLVKQYSEDPGSSKNKGLLPAFGTNKMVPEFEKAAFNLQKDGDVSDPIQTAYGWHIIKRISKKGLPSYDEAKSDIKNRISRDSRAEMSKVATITKIKNEYKFNEKTKELSEFNKVIDSTLVNGTWDIKKAKGMNKTMFTLSDKHFTQQDFAKFLVDHQTKRKGVSKEVVLQSLYEQFVDESAMTFKESRLEFEYPEFKALMEEYRDGILLFDLTDKKVWTKAVKDSNGLKDFYNKNRNNYMWKERLDASIYTCINEDAAKEARQLIQKGLSTDSISAHFAKEAAFRVSIHSGKYLRGDENIIDSIPWEKGVTKDIQTGKNIVFVNVKDIIAPEVKTMEEAKGLVTADYQASLEKEWLSSLRKKYTVLINQQVLSTVE